MEIQKENVDYLARKYAPYSDKRVQHKEWKHWNDRAKKTDGHLWKYFKSESVGTVRRCKKCGVREIMLSCWTDGLWIREEKFWQYITRLPENSIERATMAEFYLPILKKNRGLTPCGSTQ